jgi:hypothetical protein
MIWALLAVIAFIFLALLGPILYPLRLIRKWRRNKLSSTETSGDEAVPATDESTA